MSDWIRGNRSDCDITPEKNLWKIRRFRLTRKSNSGSLISHQKNTFLMMTTNNMMKVTVARITRTGDNEQSKLSLFPFPLEGAMDGLLEPSNPHSYSEDFLSLSPFSLEGVSDGLSDAVNPTSNSDEFLYSFLCPLGELEDESIFGSSGYNGYIPSHGSRGVGLDQASLTTFSNKGSDTQDEDRPVICEIVSFTGSLTKDFIILCADHDLHGTFLLQADDFNYHRCRSICFKSVLGKIFVSGLDAGINEKKSAKKEPNKGEKWVSKTSVDKKAAKVHKQKIEKAQSTRKANNDNFMKKSVTEHNDNNKSKKVIRPVELLGFQELCCWYSKHWPHVDNPFKFMMVRDTPILWVFFEKWFEIGPAAGAHTMINDLALMINRSKQLYPTDDDANFWGFRSGIRDNRGRRVKARGSHFTREFEPNPVDIFGPLKPPIIVEKGPDFNHNNDDFLTNLFGNGSVNDEVNTTTFITDDFKLEPIISNNPIYEDAPMLNRLNDDKVKTKLNLYSDGYSIGEIDDAIQLNKQQYDLMFRFLQRFDVAELSKEFIYEVLSIPFEDFSLSYPFDHTGTFTGLNHPEAWDGNWASLQNRIPINEGDFISSFHDMMTNNGYNLEKGFVDWWADAGYSAISSVMAVKNSIFGDTEPANESFGLNSFVMDRIGSNGSFVPDADINVLVHDLQEGLNGSGRGDIYDFGSGKLVAQSNYKSEDNLEGWDLSKLNKSFNTTITHSIFGSLNINYSSLFFSIGNYTQLASTLKSVSNDENSVILGPIYCPTIMVTSNTGGQKSMTISNVILNPVDQSSSTNMVFSPAWDSLGALQPKATFASVSSANRSYTTTPYGDISYMVFLFKLTNLYLTPTNANFFLGCLRMIRFACMCESGNIDYFRGGWTQSNPTRYYGNGVVAPGTQKFASTIRFVRVADFINSYNTPAMQSVASILKKPGGRMAFLGDNGSGSSGINDDTFILQLLMSGANCPNFGFVSPTQNAAGVANPDVVTTIDVMTLFREEKLVHIIVFMGSDTPNFKTGSIGYDTLAANTMIGTIVAVDVVNSLEDLIGTYIQHGFEYWIAAIYNLCVSTGTTDYFNQAMIFMLHNGSISHTAQSINNYYRYDTGNLSAVSPVTAIYPGTPSINWFDGADLTFMLAPGLELDYILEDDANWTVDEGLQINVPRETGAEHLVIYGFASPTSSPIMNLDFDLSKVWNNRFWLPEYLSQAYAETNRKYFYTSMFYNSAPPFITNMPTQIMNLYSIQSGIRSNIIPVGMLSVHEYYQKVTGMVIPWSYFQPTVGWYMRHNSSYNSRSIILPRQRPGFLMGVSKYTSERLTVWGPETGMVLRTPKPSKSTDGKLANYKSGIYTYELSQIINSGINVAYNPDDDIVTKTFAAANLCSHYLTNEIRNIRASKAIATTTGNIALTITPALRLDDGLGPFMGAHMANYSLVTYDYGNVSPIAYTNITNSSAIVVSKNLSTYMNVMSFDADINTDEADPDATEARAANLEFVNSLFTTTTISQEESKPSMSVQEEEAIQKPIGQSANLGGVPVSGALK